MQLFSGRKLTSIIMLGLALMLLGVLAVNAQPPVPHPEEESGTSYEDRQSIPRGSPGSRPSHPQGE